MSLEIFKFFCVSRSSSNCHILLRFFFPEAFILPVKKEGTSRLLISGLFFVHFHLIHFPVSICLLSSYFISFIFHVCLTVLSAESSDLRSVDFTVLSLMGISADSYDEDVGEELSVLCRNDLFLCSEFLTR